MKIKPRKPSIKRSIKAKTTGKAKRAIKKSINPTYGKKGAGWVKDPKRAAKNKIYHATTFDTRKVLAPKKHSNKKAIKKPIQSYKKTTTKLKGKSNHDTLLFWILVTLAFVGFFSGSLSGFVFAIVMGYLANKVFKRKAIEEEYTSIAKMDNVPIDSSFNINDRSEEIGYYCGKHYTEYVDQIKQLKREKKNQEAINLLNELVLVVESESAINQAGIPPFYYEQLAILYRKEKQSDKEVKILERYIEVTSQYGDPSKKLVERLNKLVVNNT
ncbi:hypothetical protein [Marinilactibacillus sp. Marseille-P9653]|uniref:hypothetical protein n=1 Tax=Marinilactibacillus sp. Marseille-P9653 TaxID=2866583 RepID=UPI001CE3C908|nr:hypothetical protein [Marinilactibacillus sp. Marseille-P9653]